MRSAYGSSVLHLTPALHALLPHTMHVQPWRCLARNGRRFRCGARTVRERCSGSSSSSSSSRGMVGAEMVELGVQELGEGGWGVGGLDSKVACLVRGERGLCVQGVGRGYRGAWFVIIG